MCHLISKASSYISGILRNMKSSMLLVAALFISSFAVVAQAEDINLTVTAPDGSSSVRLTGPWWGWDPNGGPEAASNGDGTWSVALSPTENMQYLWVVDGVQENLIDNAANAECTAEIDGGSLITDYSGWANRVWVLGTGDASNTYDACAGTAAPEPEPTGVNLVLTTDGSAVRLTGPWWGWDPNGGPEASDNGDGTWTVTLDPAPTENMEYLWVVDGVQENLIDNAANAECTAEIDGGSLITDYSGWANRVLVLDSGDAANTYDACAGSVAGPVDSDNDGVNDDEDAFPNDASETVDSDNDGVGDNADVFPNDASETADSDNDGVGDNTDYAPNDSAVQEGPKQVVSVSGNPVAVVGQTMSVEISYDVTNGDSTLTGLGLNVHYNSALITYEQFSNVLATDNILSGGPYSDDDDLDGDASTDKYVSVAWASLFGNWPNVLPASLATIDFMVGEAAADVDSVTIGFSSSSNASGYTFQGDSTDINVIGATWDFDGNGSADALSDGLLLVRYAFGLRGDKLVGDDVVADDSTLTAQEIEAKITDAQDIADIDGNGTVDPLSDGLLLLRHLFGFSGESLVKGVVHPDGSRQSAEEITSYMNGFMPQ